MDQYEISTGDADAFQEFVYRNTGQTVEFWCSYLSIRPDAQGKLQQIQQRSAFGGKPFLRYIATDSITGMTMRVQSWPQQ